MATRTHVNQQPPGYSSGVLLVHWSGLLNGDDGDWITVPEHSDIAVQVFGTLGAGGSLSFQGTNEIVATPLNPAILNDTRGEGNPMTFTTADLRQCLEAAYRVRPIVTAGDGTTTLTCAVKFNRSRG